MIIRFDSTDVKPTHTDFGFGVDPADWDAMAEDFENMEAVGRGFLPF